MAAEGQSSSGVPSNNMDIPLALRKSPRATAGIKKEPITSMEKMEAALHASKSKEGNNKSATKRKVSSPTPSSSSKDEKEERETASPSHKKRKNPIPKAIREMDSRNDFYCWICHREGSVICCEVCPRVYHVRCVKLVDEPEGDWFCPECEKITKAECVDTQSKAMSQLTLDHFCRLLMYALQRMKHSGTELFQKPVQLDQHPNYLEYVFHPMDLSTLEKNIHKKVYGSTEAFLADTKWILHNCVLYNGANHKLTTSARMIVKICEHEMSEIEICPDCYLSSCMKKENYFCEPCREPHKLVWAKLKGFPFWPAKALRHIDGQVDVRFFGQHDRAWVPASNCYLMSEEIPFPIKKRKGAFENAMQEMELHIENIRKRHGNWEYAPYRTAFDQQHCYTHNHLKTSMQKKNTLSNGLNDSNAKQSSNDASKKVAKIKIRIKKESGMPTLTLEGAGQETSDSVPGDSAKKIDTANRDANVDKTDKHLSSKSRNIFDAMKIVDTEKKSPSCPVSEKPKGLKTGLLKLKIGANGSMKGNTPDSQIKSEKSTNMSSESECVDNDGSLSQKKVPAGIFEISDGAGMVGVENQSKTTHDTAKEKQTGTGEIVRTTVDDKHDRKSMEHQRWTAMRAARKMCVSNRLNADQVAKTVPKTPEKQETKREKLSTPSILPTKLPSLSNLEEATSQLSPETTNPMTPPSNRSTPSMDKFKMHLDKTIESCKASLGIKQIDHLEEMEQEKDVESESDAASLSNNSDDESSDAMEEEDDDIEEKMDVEIGGEQKSSKDTKVGNELEDKCTDVIKTDSEHKQKINSDLNGQNSTDIGKTDETKSERILEVANTSPKTAKKPVSASPSSKNNSPVIKPSDTGSVKGQESGVTDMEVDVQKDVSDAKEPIKVKPETVVGKTKVTTQVSDKTVVKTEPKQNNTALPLKTPLKDSNTPTGDKGSSPASNGGNTQSHSPKSSTPPNLQPVKFSARLAEKAAQRAAAAAATTTEIIPSTSTKSPTEQPPRRPSVRDTVDNNSFGTTEKSYPPKSMPPIKKYTTKIMQHIEETFQDFYKDVLESGQDVSRTTDDFMSVTVKKLKVDMEITQWKHQQELAELRHNAELTVAEMRLSLQREKQNALSELKKEFMAEKQTAINETKKKQWCANCGKEAIFFCCWNTSYCDYPCQQTHWPEHMNSCAQSSSTGSTSQDSNDQSDGANIDNQVRTAVSIQQSPSDGQKPGDPIPVVVTQPMQVQYVRQPVPAAARQVVMQTQVAPPMQSYSTVIGPMNTLTRAPTTTIVQQRPIIQQGTYPVLRPQGGIVAQAPQGVRTQIVVPAQVQSVPSGTMQIRNVVNYTQSRPV
ncbi:LOW QUALITY PROTEIN: MYND-type zinc finger-containing chromatin reader ZMYND8-like [Ptychodera flava]|uniref:LOW QUALITY PROTEIN: MYND-type zinc finger-containing chromatin reader ZMYND8-like n=1 Tax=Ptychodera flava TaxID=63121 RepID=UPI00396A2C8D